MMKLKEAKPADKAKSNNFDRCQTPFYAVDPLIKYLPSDWRIWEPAVGDGNIAKKLRLAGYEVNGSDILSGTNFFNYEDEYCDCIVTNPPYSIKYDWIDRSYQIDKPWALLLPVETLGAKRAQKQFDKHGVQVMFLDKRVNFKMPNKGYGGTAQFPTAWFTWGLNLPNDMIFETFTRYEDEQLVLF